jgi:chemotaxis protein CheD
MNTATATAAQTFLVGMGETVLLHDEDTARAVVGSCIGLVLYHRRQKIAAMTHIVLPEAAGRPGLPGKFADTAIPHLLSLLGKEGAHTSGLVAVMAGGARMFGKPGPLQIGVANNDAVSAALEKLGITVRGTDVGGDKGRRMTFNCATGQLTVEVAGQSPVVL